MDQLNFPEDAQLELRSVNLENTQLRKQIHDIHHQFVEKTGDLEKQIKSLEKYSEPAQVILYLKSFCVNSIGISLVGSSVVQMWEALDLHWINHFLLDNSLGCGHMYSIDRDLSAVIIQPLNNWGQI